jgi:hypothetical protein
LTHPTLAAAVAPAAASRQVGLLRLLIAVTALAVVAAEAITLTAAAERGFALIVRGTWALLRVLGLLALMRAVRLGRAGARPFGLILAITTVFAVARLGEPRHGSYLPSLPVLVSFGVLVALCSAFALMLYRSPAIDAHLTSRPARRQVPAWVLTARVAALTYTALLAVPMLVAMGSSTSYTSARLVVLVDWIVLFVAVAVAVPAVSFFVVVGSRWARFLLGVISVAVLVLQPVMCYLLLGVDGLVRDGTPMIITALLGLVALRRSRGQPTWVRPAPT